jgi:hypothetical protein
MIAIAIAPPLFDYAITPADFMFSRFSLIFITLSLLIRHYFAISIFSHYAFIRLITLSPLLADITPFSLRLITRYATLPRRRHFISILIIFFHCFRLIIVFDD